MKSLSKNIIAGMVISAVSVAAPFAAFAENGTSASVNAKVKMDFCTMIQTEDFNRFTKMEDRIDNRRDDRDVKIDNRRDDRDQKRDEKSQDMMAKAGVRAGALMDQNLTDAQKAALVQAQANIKIALDTKSGDIDALVAEYRAAMDKIRAEHRTEVDALMVQIKADVDAAVAKAKADCAAGTSSETAKTQFQASMKAIHEKYKPQLEAFKVSAKGDMKSEADARKGDRTEINAGFRASWQSAWLSFKALFNKKAQ